MNHFISRGNKIRGIEVDGDQIQNCRNLGLDVYEGSAEKVPFPDNSFDCIVCSVVLPYTDERLAISEWHRIIKPGGRIFATYQGFGYAFEYVLRDRKIRKRFYGLRMLLNTYFYWMTSKRLPFFLGDTLCQSKNRLRSYYESLGLVLDQEVIAGTTAGFPQFFCHQLSKPYQSSKSCQSEATPKR